mmetsp:Transcript_19972/g.69330  ORF Transcript_19972/g.69330 Transcript_19972/m.69330 type:complete len:109 (-) Transcript_19972:2375-2701(-)
MWRDAQTSEWVHAPTTGMNLRGPVWPARASHNVSMMAGLLRPPLGSPPEPVPPRMLPLKARAWSMLLDQAPAPGLLLSPVLLLALLQRNWNCSWHRGGASKSATLEAL